MQNVPTLPADLLWMLVTPDQIWGFVLTACRLFGCLQFAPLTSDASIPMRMRIVLSGVMAWLVVAITPFQLSDITHPLPMVMILELAIGATIGLSAQQSRDQPHKWQYEKRRTYGAASYHLWNVDAE